MPDEVSGDRSPSVRMDASAHGDARVYQVGRGVQVIYDLGGLQARASAVVVPVAAPEAAPGSVFVGRDDAVTALLGFLDPAAEGSPAVVVSSVSGLAGVGKTALAAQVAGLAVGRGWYPGGAVFTDLHGYDPDNRVRPGQLYGPLLRALGVPVEQIPPVPDEQAAAYHQHLALRAEQGRPVLLVLDNVSGPDQAADLLPRHRIHRALITSRHTLGELDGVRILDLDVLAEADAVDLLDQVLRSREPSDRRITEQPGQARELARLCGGLPLALRITAALLADDIAMPLVDMVAELADTSTRLSGLSYGERAVASAFDLSFRHLGERDARAARMFWLLSVNPGPEVATEAAAVLAGEPVPRVRGRLRVLRQAHLVERGTDTGRWRMHDLVGLFAAQLAETETELPAARDRLLRHYLAGADAADDHLGALAVEPTPDRFPGRESALAWLDTERPNLVAAVDLAADTGHEAVAVDLALALARFLDRRRHLDDHLATAATAVRAAERMADPSRRGRALNALGMALADLRRFDEAIAAYQQALAVHRDNGNRRSEARTLANLGFALTEVRRFDEATEVFERAAVVFRDLGDRHGEAMVLTNSAWTLQQQRRFDEAIAAHRRAVRIFAEVGDRDHEGRALNNLGGALVQAQRFAEAVGVAERAVAVTIELGDRHAEASALSVLGLALAGTGGLDDAITAYEQDLAICREIGDRYGEGQTLGNIGAALQQAGRFAEALPMHERAADICREFADRHGEAEELGNIGSALRELGRFGESVAIHERAAVIFEELGDRYRVGTELGNLGLAHQAASRLAKARECWQRASELFTELGASDDAQEVHRLLAEPG